MSSSKSKDNNGLESALEKKLTIGETGDSNNNNNPQLSYMNTSSTFSNTTSTSSCSSFYNSCSSLPSSRRNSDSVSINQSNSLSNSTEQLIVNDQQRQSANNDTNELDNQKNLETSSISEDVEKEVLDDEPRSIIRDLLSQLRKGTDLHRITLPTFVLEPRTLLERVTDFMTHPQLILHAHLENDPVRRFIMVLQYYLSGWHIRPKGIKKPYNPVLGEFFKCTWEISNIKHGTNYLDGFDHLPEYDDTSDHHHPSDALKMMHPSKSTSDIASSNPNLLQSIEKDKASSTTNLSGMKSCQEGKSFIEGSMGNRRDVPHMPNPSPPFCPHCDSSNPSSPPSSKSYYFAEQVSHHPPISAYLYANPTHHTIIRGNFRPKGKFLGNSGASIMHGTSHIYFTNRDDEEYIVTNPNIYIRGIFIGTMLMELGDSVTIECKKSNLIAEIDFKVKGYITGTYNAISGKIKEIDSGTPLYQITGKWTDKMKITPLHPKVYQFEIPTNVKPKHYKEDPHLLIDVAKLPRAPKNVAPEDQQHDYESRKLWSLVTKALYSRDLNTATVEKTKIEDKQRAESKERAKWIKSNKNKAKYGASEGDEDIIPWSTRYFTTEDGVNWYFKKDLKGLSPQQIESFLQSLYDMKDSRIETTTNVDGGSQSTGSLLTSESVNPDTATIPQIIVDNQVEDDSFRDR